MLILSNDATALGLELIRRSHKVFTAEDLDYLCVRGNWAKRDTSPQNPQVHGLPLSCSAVDSDMKTYLLDMRRLTGSAPELEFDKPK